MAFTNRPVVGGETPGHAGYMRYGGYTHCISLCSATDWLAGPLAACKY